MATDVEGKGSSPRIKFRWCRTVPVQTREIHLVLTSVTRTRIALQWKNELGWYESELVSLPCGLHSGFLLIREKVRPSFFHSDPSASLSVDERDYTIDPFFVSAHKYSVELFVQSDRSAGIWQDNPFLKERYLSSPHLETRRDNASKEDEALSISLRKWRSYQELRKSVCWEAEDQRNEDSSTQDKTPTRNDTVPQATPVKWSEDEPSKWTSRGSSSGIGLGKWCEEGLLSQPSCWTTLRKWSSLGERDDFSHERSQNEAFQVAPSKSEGCKLIAPAHDRYVKRTIAPSDAEFFNKLKTETLARVQAVESLLKQSDDEVDEGKEGTRLDLYFKEVNPSTKEGYGCLITFESRSTSMDDLGSPRALEDVLVSLTSSDTDPKPYPSISVGGTETLFVETHEESFLSPSQVQRKRKALKLEHECSPTESETSTQSQAEGDDGDVINHWGWSSKEEESKHLESDITINENENFQYDSLKNDDQTIPLNIKAVLDSENSSDYSSINVCSKPAFHSGRSTENAEGKKVAASDASETPREEPNSGDDNDEGHKQKRKGSYNLVSRKSLPSSAKGAVATNSLVLFHPGSLRSETVTESSGTLVESKKSSDTLKETLESSGLYKKSQRKVPDQDTLLRDKGPTRHVNGSSALLRLTTKDQEKGAASRKAKKSSSLSKTILIIRDKKNPRMNSTGTQTTHRGSPALRMGRVMANRSLPTSFASSFKGTLLYSPLPDKVNGPWTAKLGNERAVDNYPYFENSNIKKLQKNLYNIAKADQILRKIHPFDYRPTLIHADSRSQIGFSDSLQPSAKRALKSTKTITSRVSQSPSKLHSSSFPPTTAPHYKSFLSVPSRFRHSVLHRNASELSQTSYSSPSRIKKVPRPHFSIYGKDFSDSSGDRSSGSIGSRTRPHRSLDYQPHFRSSSILSRGVGETLSMRPATSLPDLRGTRDDTSRPLYSRQLLRGKAPARAYSSPPAYTGDYDLEKSCISRPIFSLQSRRGSFKDHFGVSGSSSGSTDSLIEEAEDVTTSYTRGPKFEGRSREETSRLRWRGAETSAGVFRDITGTRSPSAAASYRIVESSVADCLRARSETDLRMIGKLTGGRQGEPPYLPYSRKELSLGQIVKVLVPGEGVALARVVYNPAVDASCLRGGSSTNQDITVVLISEPTNMAGSVITVPLNKILLAWPKA